MRKRIYEIIEVAGKEDSASRTYDIVMICLIIISMVPLAMKNPSFIWESAEKICVGVFLVDYLLRLFTADYKYNSHSITSFIRYPFSPMAIVDMISILPSFVPINSGFRIFRLLRMSRALRVLRVFRTLRYSKNFEMIITVIKKSKDSLIAVGSLTIGYILVSALIVFNVEPESFNSFYEAVYWATVSLTTVGYGDIYPVSTVGRSITMISSMFGIAIVALPAGIITAEFMSELSNSKNESADNE